MKTKRLGQNDREYVITFRLAEALIRSREELRPHAVNGSASLPKPKAGAASRGSPARFRCGASTFTSRASRCATAATARAAALRHADWCPRISAFRGKCSRKTIASRWRFLDPGAKGEVEKEFIEPFFTIDQGGIIPTVKDFRDVPLLEVKAARRGQVLRACQARTF